MTIMVKQLQNILKPLRGNMADIYGEEGRAKVIIHLLLSQNQRML